MLLKTNRGNLLKVKNGIDLLPENINKLLKDRYFSLITTSSVVNAGGIPLYLMLKELKGKYLKSIWSLQHGFFIDKQDNMIFSEPFNWDQMGLKIRSLYAEKLIPETAWIKSIDLIVIDVFDVGTRVYTFLNHLVKILRFLSGRGVDILVLDRVNPLNGLDCEGNCADRKYFSIVSQIDVPMRHGLTCGEFLKYAVNYYNLDLKLDVLAIKGWKRAELFKGLWTYPSPNMPSFKTGLVYPGAVMLEGTNVSEGRGTTKPFEIIGSPFIDNIELSKKLNSSGLKGVDFIPLFFKPEFSKYQGQICKGLFVNVNDPVILRSFAVYYEIIRKIRMGYPAEFAWNKNPYEFEFNRPAIDMITGSDLIRKAIDDNIPYRELEPKINEQIQSYREKRFPFLLY